MLGSVERGIAKMAGLERSWETRWERAQAPLAAILSLRAEMLAEIREGMERREDELENGEEMGARADATDVDRGHRSADKSFEEEARDLVEQLLAQKQAYQDTSQRLWLATPSLSSGESKQASGKGADLVWRPADERHDVMQHAARHAARSPQASLQTETYGFSPRHREMQGVATSMEEVAQLSCSTCSGRHESSRPAVSRPCAMRRIREKLEDLDESLRSTRREIEQEQEQVGGDHRVWIGS
eukprot:756760-Hanusia_phi.AAC.2